MPPNFFPIFARAPCKMQQAITQDKERHQQLMEPYWEEKRISPVRARKLRPIL